MAQTLQGCARLGRCAGGRPTIGTAALSLSAADAARIESHACKPPGDVGIPVTHWSAALLGTHVRAEGIETSDRTVGRILASADLQPHRQKMYLTSHDEDFRQKRDDVLHVYYDTPSDEHIVCLDEKTGMQALERKVADLPMEPGQPVRREFEYIRHGTLCLMGDETARFAGRLRRTGLAERSSGIQRPSSKVSMARLCQGVMSGASSQVGRRPMPVPVVLTCVASISARVRIIARADFFVS